MKKKGNKIGWCDKTANPVWGCPNNCPFECYARGINDRFKRIPDFSKPQFFPNALKEFRTKEPMIIFIDSMSDIGWWKPEWFLDTVTAMYNNPQNIYLALTKSLIRAKDLHRLTSIKSDFKERVRFFIGATVTNNAQARAVIEAGGADFISFEPLLERIKPELLAKLQCKWWIVGDLTKAGKPQSVTCYQWVDDMAQLCKRYNIPLFMKDSLTHIVGSAFVQEFPKGWKA